MPAICRSVALVLLVLLITACGSELTPPDGVSTSGSGSRLEAETPSSAGDAQLASASLPALPASSPRPTVIVERVANDPLVLGLVTGLQQRGFVVAPGDVSAVGLLEAAPGQSYQLNDGRLYLHLYADAEAAAAEAAALPRNLRDSILDWIAPPHFFQCDRVIALYLGADRRAIQALSTLCAPPFYTTDLSPAAPAPTESPLVSIELAVDALLRSGPSATGTPEIRKQVQLQSGVALLYTYAALQDEQPVTVTRLSYLDWRDPVWYPDGDQLDLRAANAAVPPIQFLMGTYVVNGGPDTAEKPDSITFAGGLVNDPAIRRVRVVFDDGAQEVAEVEQGAYLVAKLDVQPVSRLEALDAQGKVIYQQRGM